MSTVARPAFPFHGIFSSLDREQSAVREDVPVASAVAPAAAGQQTKGQVAVDIYEHENYYIIKAPIAGVRLCDLDIEISDNVITISGTRQQTDDIPTENYYLQECYWGPFSRSVTLPFTIDPKRIRATFNKECILKILVPKEEKVKIVRINEA